MYCSQNTVFWDILVSSYFRHFGSDGYSFILATCCCMAKNRHNSLLWCLWWACFLYMRIWPIINQGQNIPNYGGSM